MQSVVFCERTGQNIATNLEHSTVGRGFGLLFGHGIFIMSMNDSYSYVAVFLFSINGVNVPTIALMIS